MLIDNSFTMDNRVYRIAKTLTEAGYDLTLYAVKKKSLPNKEIIDGIKVVRVFDERLFDIKKINYPKKAAEIILKSHPHIVHAHDNLMLHVARFVKIKSPATKLIYDSHELFCSWPIHYSSNTLIIKIKSWIVRQIEIRNERLDSKYIDQCITVGSAIAKYLDSYFKTKKPTILVRNFADIEDITRRDDTVRKAFNIPSSSKIVVLFSLFIYKKRRNIEAIISQFGNKENVAVVIFCNPQGHKSYFEELVKTLGYKNIYFHEAISQDMIVNTLASCDIGVIPTWDKKHLSYWLGLENKLFHYIISELPILSSATPEHQAIINQYNIGECANGDIPNDYYRAYEKIISNYSFYKSNVIASKTILSWQTEKNNLLSLYQELTHNTTSS